MSVCHQPESTSNKVVEIQNGQLDLNQFSSCTHILTKTHEMCKLGLFLIEGAIKIRLS